MTLVNFGLVCETGMESCILRGQGLGFHRVGLGLKTKSKYYFTLIKTGYTVFTRLNAVAFIKFLAFLIQHYFIQGLQYVYFKSIFLKSLTTITVKYL